MIHLEEDRNKAIKVLLSNTLAIIDKGKVTRSSLEPIRTSLNEIARRVELWQEEDYPAPQGEEKQNRYLVGQDESGISLYLNIVRPGKRVAPHNHTTWACISAVEGVEHNTLYDRLDDGSKPGFATIKEREIIPVEPGYCLAMLGDDIHSFEVRGEQTIRHLHFYGRPLETLDQRIAFDMEKGTYHIMDIGVNTKIKGKD